jgi:AcrR family transcriptional regulator
VNPTKAVLGTSAAEPAAANGAKNKPRVRDRIFETACKLFYTHGIRNVGIDTITSEAGTNKMSFYRSFNSKDELVAEYLESKGNEFWTRWNEIVAQHAAPRAQIEALFDAFVCNSFFQNSRGCAFANAGAELAELDHPGRLVAANHKAETRRRWRELAARAGAARSEELGDALMLLMEGGNLTRHTFQDNGGPLQAAAATARVLLDAYTRAG